MVEVWVIWPLWKPAWTSGNSLLMVGPDIVKDYAKMRDKANCRIIGAILEVALFGNEMNIFNPVSMCSFAKFCGTSLWWLWEVRASAFLQDTSILGALLLGNCFFAHSISSWKIAKSISASLSSFWRDWVSLLLTYSLFIYFVFHTSKQPISLKERLFCIFPPSVLDTLLVRQLFLVSDAFISTKLCFTQLFWWFHLRYWGIDLVNYDFEVLSTDLDGHNMNINHWEALPEWVSCWW